MNHTVFGFCFVMAFYGPVNILTLSCWADCLTYSQCFGVVNHTFTNNRQLPILDQQEEESVYSILCVQSLHVWIVIWTGYSVRPTAIGNCLSWISRRRRECVIYSILWAQSLHVWTVIWTGYTVRPTANCAIWALTLELSFFLHKTLII